MAALALIIKDLGNDVIGADVESKMFTEEKLLKNNIIIERLDKMNIKKDDIIVVGNAFLEKYNYPNNEVLTYQELLSIIADKYYSIAVCGTHGKTTITNMLKHVLLSFEKTGYLVGDGSGHIPKDAKYFVYEACEHKEHFLNYFPDIILCNNIDYDHVEFYKSKEQYKKAFYKFFNHKKDSLILFNKIRHKKDINYGINKGIVHAKKIKYFSDGIYFDLIVNKEEYKGVYLPFFGKHMLIDSLACLSVCYKLNLNIDECIKVLSKYKMAQRRYNITNVKDCVIIDDYGHHPNEIKETIKAIKQQYKDKKIFVFYHPDRPKRLVTFAYKFISTFKKATTTYILPFFNNGKEEENAINVVVDNHKIKRFDSKVLSYSYKNTVFLFTGSKEMKQEINMLKNNILNN